MSGLRIIATLLLFSVVISCNQTSQETIKTAPVNNTPKVEKLLRHIVLFKFKDSSSVQEVQKVTKAFVALPDAIKEVHNFEWGTNNSPENLNKGLTHSFLVTFTSEKDRDVYLTHPAHLAFVEVLKPHLDDVLVLDYWIE